MRIAFIEPEVPNREFSTVSHCARLFLDALQRADHEVTAVLPLPSRSMISDDLTRQRWIQELKDDGIPVVVTPGDPPAAPPLTGLAWRRNQARRLLRPIIADYFAHVGLRDSMAAALAPLRPDVLFIWGGYEGVAASHAIDIAPRFAFMGDPGHLPGLYRERPPIVGSRWPTSPRFALYRLEARRKAQVMNRMLRQCEAVGATAAHHAEWFRTHGVPQCVYLPNMVPDWGGPAWRERRQAAKQTGPFKIVLMGHVTGTATLAGLHLFANDTLPVLERELGDGFVVHICGKGSLPTSLSDKLQGYGVRMRGYVDDIVTEIRSSDVFLVPTPIELGIRVRIPYAWSAGACVVTHQANAAGLPELRHGHNALLASSGVALAQAIIRVARDPVLQHRLILAGRDTYETSYAHPVTFNKVMGQIDRIVDASSFERQRIAA